MNHLSTTSCMLGWTNTQAEKKSCFKVHRVCSGWRMGRGMRRGNITTRFLPHDRSCQHFRGISLDFMVAIFFVSGCRRTQLDCVSIGMFANIRGGYLMASNIYRRAHPCGQCLLNFRFHKFRSIAFRIETPQCE